MERGRKKRRRARDADRAPFRCLCFPLPGSALSPFFVSASRWLHAVLGDACDDLYESLKSGVQLCTLLNKIRPATIKKINKTSIAFMQMENIKNYLDGCKLLGMADRDLFVTVDLYERKNIPQVAHSVLELGKLARTIPTFAGPYPGKGAAVEAKQLDSILAADSAPPAGAAAASVAAAAEDLQNTHTRARRASASQNNAPLTMAKRPSIIGGVAPGATPAPSQQRPAAVAENNSAADAARAAAMAAETAKLKAELEEMRESLRRAEEEKARVAAAAAKAAELDAALQKSKAEEVRT